MRKNRIFAAIISLMMMLFAFNVSVFAENTDDYEFVESDMFDFCVYNIWADNYIDEPFQPITSIKMEVEVTDYAGDPLSVKLYTRESKTWLTWASEAQEISEDGTYAFIVDVGEENTFTPEELCTIYLKDPRCCTADEDPELGEELDESGVACHVVLKSVEYNVSADDVEDPAEDPEDDVVTDDTDSETQVEEATSAAPQTDATTAAPANNNSSKSDKKGGFFPMPGIPIIAGVVVVIAVVAVVAGKKKN